MKVAHVNTTDIRGAITLGCRTMSRVFNADDNDVPFFESFVRPEARFGFHPFHSESHVPGRHLNALLNAEALGVPVEESVIEKHARAAFFSFSGPIPLPLNRERIGGELVVFNPHNIREGLHALGALAAFRDSAPARDMAEATIAAVFDLWDPERGWDTARLEGALGLTLIGADSPFIAGVARALGPLVKYRRAWGSSAALALATALADKAAGEYFLADGACDIGRLGTHTHSITSVLSSLAQRAEATRDAGLMGRVKAFYDNGLWTIRNELGWSPESLRPDADPDRGEANTTGDILETALILGRWGFTECYADAERVLRGHLLPCQLRDVSFIREPDNPEGADARRDVGPRHLGAFGFPAPYGHHPRGSDFVSFNLDIVGGAVGSLCEAFRHAAPSDADGHRINLLFDHETDALKVEALEADGALRVTVKRAAPLMIRVPPWAPRDDIKVTGAVALPRLVNGYLSIPQPPREAFHITFPMPHREIVLRYQDRLIRVRLKGDHVEQMENFGMDLTFFDPLT